MPHAHIIVLLFMVDNFSRVSSRLLDIDKCVDTNGFKDEGVLPHRFPSVKAEGAKIHPSGSSTKHRNKMMRKPAVSFVHISSRLNS